MLNIENIQDFVLGLIIAGAPVVRGKKVTTVKAYRGTPGEVISTAIDATKNVVSIDEKTNKAGWVVTNPGGEKYIIKDSTFNEYYEKVSEGVYRKKVTQLLVPCSVTVEFVPSWGGTFTVEAGGYFTLNGPHDIAGIQSDAFEETYEIIDDGANLKEEALRLLLNK